MPMTKAQTDEMRAIASKIKRQNEALSQSQAIMKNIVGNIGLCFGGVLPSLILKNLLQILFKAKTMNENVENYYAGFIDHAANKYEADFDNLMAKEIEANAGGDVTAEGAAPQGNHDGKGRSPVEGGTFDEKDGFGVKRSGVGTDFPNGHNGYDIRGNGGESVVSPAPVEGKVIVSKDNPGGYGNYAMVEYKIGDQYYYVVFAHLQELPSVKVGDVINVGDQIGKLGATGAANDVQHLHLDVRQNAQNPTKQLNGSTAFSSEDFEFIDPGIFFDAIGVKL
jgi:murein DD-endopeptidase MepM/ murein hydrolase activator NlpD